MEEEKNDPLLSDAIKRQESRARNRTYLDMQDSLRGFESLSDESRKKRTRAPFFEAMEGSNLQMKKAIEQFKASNLPASSYIK